MRTLLCCIGRKENAYVREFVEYYKNLGFTNICLYDNNYDGEDDFYDVIGDYIDEGFVILKNYRNLTTCQLKAYTECYKEYGGEYDWVAFFDLDEFLTFTNCKNVEEYLGRDIFNHFDMIHINWMCYGDGGRAKSDGRPLLERISTPVLPYDKHIGYNFPENNHIKSIIRGGLDNVIWDMHPHSVKYVKKCCDSIGKSCENTSPFHPYNYEEAYLRHFSTKTAEEYANKMIKGFPDREWDIKKEAKFLTETRFFRYNEPTQEKVDVFKEKLGIDFSYLLPLQEYDGEKSKDIQIFSLCYSKKDFKFIDNKYVTPLQVGAANGTNVCNLKDNTGENISGLNFFFIENTGLYWIWKNVKEAKYKGQMQYRRPLDGINEDTNFEEIFSKYDVITCEPFHHPDHKEPKFEGDPVIVADTVEQGYAFSNCIDDIQILEMVIKLYFPAYAEDWDKYIKNGPDLYYSNGFILKAEEYDKYCEFLFAALNGYLNMANIHTYADLINHVKYNLETGKYIRYKNANIPQEAIKWQSEIGGFLSERLWTLWLLHNYSHDKIYRLPYVKQEKNQWI